MCFFSFGGVRVKTKVIKLKGGPLGQREGKRKRKGSHKKE
jgi:hypothetical protein